MLIRFYSDSDFFMGVKDYNTIINHYFELKSWIESGNYIIIQGLKIASIIKLKSIVSDLEKKLNWDKLCTQ